MGSLSITMISMTFMTFLMRMTSTNGLKISKKSITSKVKVSTFNQTSLNSNNLSKEGTWKHCENIVGNKDKRPWIINLNFSEDNIFCCCFFFFFFSLARNPHSPEPCLLTDQNFVNNFRKGSPRNISVKLKI